MFLGRYEVRTTWHGIGGPTPIKMCRLHSRKRAEERAAHVGGYVVDRKMWRTW